MKFFFLVLLCFLFSFVSLNAQSNTHVTPKEIISTERSVQIKPTTFSSEKPNINPPPKASLTIRPKSFNKIQAKKVATGNSSSISRNTQSSPYLIDAAYLQQYIKTTEALIDKLKARGLNTSDTSLLKAETALENAKLKLAFLSN